MARRSLAARSVARAGARLLVTGTIAVGVAAVAGRGLNAAAERAINRTHRRPPSRPSERARELHRRLLIVDLHADSLLWGRDLLRRSRRGHVDVPRLIDGNVAVQAFAAAVRVPWGINLERNEDRGDLVTMLAVAQGWPPRTWRSLPARALFFAARLRGMADRSGGRLTVLESSTDLRDYLDRRASDRAITAGLLAIEGAHVLEGDLDTIDRLADAGFRMMSPSHFFDTDMGGSAHGVTKGGLTPLGRAMIERMERRGMVVDIAHASIPTIDDVLATGTRPVVASHTGVRGTSDSVRNLSDDHLRGIAATGGLVGIGFWPVACGGSDAHAIARSIAHAAGVAGIEHVGLGSDFDGAVPTPFDASGMVQVTEALLAEGLAEDDIALVMGGNALRLLAGALPATVTGQRP
jgi:membrane dipeptidase